MCHLTLSTLQVDLNVLEFNHLIKVFSVDESVASHITKITMVILTIKGMIVFRAQDSKSIEILFCFYSNHLILHKLTLSIVLLLH